MGCWPLAFGAAYSFGAFFRSIQMQFDAGRFSVGSLFAVTALLHHRAHTGTFSRPHRPAPRNRRRDPP